MLAAVTAMDRVERHEHVLMSARISGAAGEVEIHNVHAPNGSANGWAKVEALELIHGRLTRRASGLRVLCGDLNAPRIERRDGTPRRVGSGIATAWKVATSTT